MTFINIVSAIVFLTVVVSAVCTYRKLHREIDDAEGLCEINERGEIGTSDEGDVVGRA